MSQQQRLSVKKQEDSPGCPLAEPAFCQPIEAESCQEECSEIRKVPEIRREYIRKYSLNDPNQNRDNGDESGSVALI